MTKRGGPTLHRDKKRGQGPIIEYKGDMRLTLATVRRQVVVVHVAEIAPEADDARRAPADAAYGIAEPVARGTHVAVAFPATCSHVSVTLDAGGTVTTGEQRPAETLTGRLVALDRIATEGRAVAR